MGWDRRPAQVWQPAGTRSPPWAPALLPPPAVRRSKAPGARHTHRRAGSRPHLPPAAPCRAPRSRRRAGRRRGLWEPGRPAPRLSGPGTPAPARALPQRPGLAAPGWPGAVRGPEPAHPGPEALGSREEGRRGFEDPLTHFFSRCHCYSNTLHAGSRAAPGEPTLWGRDQERGEGPPSDPIFCGQEPSFLACPGLSAIGWGQRKVGCTLPACGRRGYPGRPGRLAGQWSQEGLMWSPTPVLVPSGCLRVWRL